MVVFLFDLYMFFMYYVLAHYLWYTYVVNIFFKYITGLFTLLMVCCQQQYFKKEIIQNISKYSKYYLHLNVNSVLYDTQRKVKIELLVG